MVPLLAWVFSSPVVSFFNEAEMEWQVPLWTPLSLGILWQWSSSGERDVLRAYIRGFRHHAWVQIVFVLFQTL